jgi:hypothetical protein
MVQRPQGPGGMAGHPSEGKVKDKYRALLIPGSVTDKEHRHGVYQALAAAACSLPPGITLPVQLLSRLSTLHQTCRNRRRQDRVESTAARNQGTLSGRRQSAGIHSRGNAVRALVGDSAPRSKRHRLPLPNALHSYRDYTHSDPGSRGLDERLKVMEDRDHMDISGAGRERLLSSLVRNHK